MPKAEHHKTKADRNREMLSNINQEEHPDWAIVVMFSFAVHWVEMLRSKKSDGHSDSHESRQFCIQQTIPDMHTDYVILENLSMLARYQSFTEFFKAVQPGEIETKLKPRLLNIHQFVQVACS